MQPSIACATAASEHTTAPINHTRPSPHKHSPDGATKADIWLQLTTQFIDPERMKGWAGLVGWSALLQRTIYPHMWSPDRCRSRKGQGKFAGQRPTFYHCATLAGVQVIINNNTLNQISQLPKLCVKISILMHRHMWVSSFSMRLMSVTFAEDKVLIFLILRKNAKIVQLWV